MNIERTSCNSKLYTDLSFPKTHYLAKACLWIPFPPEEPGGPARALGSSFAGPAHSLTGLRLADNPQTAIGGKAWHAEHTERGRHRRNGRIELAKGGAVEAYAVRERMRTPARYCHNDVAFRITGMVRGEYARNRLTGHDIAELHRRGI